MQHLSYLPSWSRFLKSFMILLNCLVRFQGSQYSPWPLAEHDWQTTRTTMSVVSIYSIMILSAIHENVVLFHFKLQALESPSLLDLFISKQLNSRIYGNIIEIGARITRYDTENSLVASCNNQCKDIYSIFYRYGWFQLNT